MSKVFEGDEWKSADVPASAVITLTRRTRAQQQSWLDNQYGQGRITREQWRHNFDFIGGLNADGSFRTLRPA